MQKPKTHRHEAQGVRIGNASEPWAQWDSDAEVLDTPPLTRQQAKLLNETLGSVSLEAFLVKVLTWQAATALVVAGLTWWVSGGLAAASSALYGAGCVVLPSALVARVVIKRMALNALGRGSERLLGLFLLELVKVAVTICLLVAAPLVLDAPQWIAIVVGFAVTLKVYWLVALMGLRRAKHVKKIGINE